VAAFNAQVGRHTIHFSDHALDRFWERCCHEGYIGRREALLRLRAALAGLERIQRQPPPWLRTSWWNIARAEGYLVVLEDTCIVVNRNANGDRVAVTTIVRDADPVAA